MLVQANNSIRNHSVPLIESSSGLLGVEAAVAFILNHHDDILSEDPFRLQVESDSECHLWCMDPNKLHRSVLVKNLSRSIHLLLRDISMSFPCLTITYSHVESLKNCADGNSKVQQDPVGVINSAEWRHGQPYFLDPTMPLAKDIFLTVKVGVPLWTPPAVAPHEQSCSACTTPCPCLPCTWSNVDVSECSESNHELAQVGANHLISKTRWPLVTSRENTTESPPWKAALESLPDLSNSFYEDLISRRSITFAIRSIARVLVISLDADLLERFGIRNSFIADQRLLEKESENKTIISNSEITPAFRKLCYLAMVKWSNKQYPPSSTKMNLFTIADIQFIVTRYSEAAMQAVYGSALLPYVSSQHHALIFRLFQAAHIRHNPSNSQDVGIYHLSLTSTLQEMRAGDFAVITTHQRKVISSLVNKCSFCILRGQSERLYSHRPGDPRILDFLHASDLPFHTISIDLMSDIWVKSHSKARGKPSHCISVLIALDLATGGICLTAASDSKSNSVIKCLKMLGLRFRFPKRIITDAGSSLSNLASHPELLQQLTANSVELISVGQGEQSSNFVERQVSSCKKILNSLREDANSSIFFQNNSLEELIGKLYSVESIMNSRPILLSHKSSDIQLLCPKMLLSPFLNSEQLKSWIMDALDPLTALPNTASLIVKNHSAVQDALQSALLDYLQKEGIKYPTRQGDNSKNDIQNLTPLVDDIIIYQTSEKRCRFGVIVEILPKNMVIIRTTRNGVIENVSKHLRLLKLLYRSSEWLKNGIPKALH